jgi:hypothetical protein
MLVPERCAPAMQMAVLAVDESFKCFASRNRQIAMESHNNYHRYRTSQTPL